MPYTQMKTAMPPLEVAATEGTRIHLRDGRTLIDGISSWWTACHGYNHPAIVSAIQQQAASMPHVMMGGLTHKPAQQLANSLADLLPGNRNKVFSGGLRFRRRRSCYEDGGSVLAKPNERSAREKSVRVFSKLIPWRHHGRDERLRSGR